MLNYKGITLDLLENFPEYFSGETNNDPSETVPGQAISAKDAVIKSLNNIPVRCMSKPEDAPYDGYEDDVDLDSISSQPHFDSEMDVADYRTTLLDRLSQARAAQAQTVPEETVPEETAAPDPTAKQLKQPEETPAPQA